MENLVTITTAEYVDLKLTEYKFKILLSAMLNGSRLSYGGDGLYDEGDALNTALPFVCGTEYRARLKELQKKKEEKDGNTV